LAEDDKTGGVAPRRYCVALAFAIATVLASADPSLAAITVPAGYGTVLSGATDGGCNVVEYGYSTTAKATRVHVDTHVPDGACDSQPLARAVIPAAASPQSLIVYIQDDNCSQAIYWSDGTGTADHAFVAGSNPYAVYLDDGGGACVDWNSAKIPSPGAYNFTVNVKVTPPPVVTVTAPAPPSGQAGYFNSKNVAASGGGIPVTVSASDQSSLGVASLGCTDNGTSTPVTAVSGAGTGMMKGTVEMSANGGHQIVCTAADNAGGSGNSGGANTATVNIDSTAPIVSAPARPVAVPATGPSGARLLSYPVSVSDPDAGDSPTISCRPKPPATFPIGFTTVTCDATDRAGNTSTARFVVDVVTPSTSFGSITTSGATSHVTIACAGIRGQTCTSELIATTKEVLRRSSVVALSAAAKHDRPRTRTVVVARAGFSVAAGKRASVRITLNSAGRRLLSEFYRVPTTFAFTAASGSRTRQTQTEIFSYPRITSLIAYVFVFHARSTSVSQLTVNQVPQSAAVKAVCDGGGCPYGERTFKRKGTVVLAGALRGAQLSPGTTIAILITAPNRVGKVVVFTTHAGGPPTAAQRCLPPGARRPLMCA
jgi:hypothetical protein